MLGAGPMGIVSGRLIPSLTAELNLTRRYIDLGRPVIGIGIGACMLSAAAGGGAVAAPLRFALEEARSCGAGGGLLPETFPVAVFMRDRPAPPPDAAILAVGSGGEPLVFRCRDNCFGFIGHPGVKSAMIEDLIMEFGEAPDNAAETLAALRAAQGEIAQALTSIMVGVVKITRLMEQPT